MSGIEFVINGVGKKTAVIIDLKKYGQMWEDFYDAIVSKQRRNEPRESLESVKKKFIQSGKL